MIDMEGNTSERMLLDIFFFLRIDDGIECGWPQNPHVIMSSRVFVGFRVEGKEESGADLQVEDITFFTAVYAPLKCFFWGCG